MAEPCSSLPAGSCVLYPPSHRESNPCAVIAPGDTAPIGASHLRSWCGWWASAASKQLGVLRGCGVEATSRNGVKGYGRMHLHPPWMQRIFREVAMFGYVSSSLKPSLQPEQNLCSGNVARVLGVPKLKSTRPENCPGCTRGQPQGGVPFGGARGIRPVGCL